MKIIKIQEEEKAEKALSRLLSEREKYVKLDDNKKKIPTDFYVIRSPYQNTKICDVRHSLIPYPAYKKRLRRGRVAVPSALNRRMFLHPSDGDWGSAPTSRVKLF